MMTEAGAGAGARSPASAPAACASPLPRAATARRRGRSPPSTARSRRTIRRRRASAPNTPLCATHRRHRAEPARPRHRRRRMGAAQRWSCSSSTRTSAATASGSWSTTCWRAPAQQRRPDRALPRLPGRRVRGPLPRHARRQAPAARDHGAALRRAGACPRALADRDGRRAGGARPAPLAQGRASGAMLALAGGGALRRVLLLIYIVLRLILMSDRRAPSIAALRAINPDEPLRLSRVGAARRRCRGQRRRLAALRNFLAPEIAQDLVAVEEDASDGARAHHGRPAVPVRLRRSSSPAARPLFERIGAAIENEPGAVTVEGHADSDRVSSLAFPDNHRAVAGARGDGRRRSSAAS